MRTRTNIAYVGAGAGAAVLLCATPALGLHPVGGPSIQVTMNGQNEVSPTGQVGVGDPDGTAVASFYRDHEDLLVTVGYQNISGEAISGLHIHGPGATATNTRPVFIGLDFLPSSATLPNGEISSRVNGWQDPAIEARINQVFANPGEFYINLHTSGAGGFPDGAVRAQLPEPGWAAGAIALAAAGLGRLGCRRHVDAVA